MVHHDGELSHSGKVDEGFAIGRRDRKTGELDCACLRHIGFIVVELRRDPLFARIEPEMPVQSEKSL